MKIIPSWLYSLAQLVKMNLYLVPGTGNWQLQEAKSKFSMLVEKTLHHEPQYVTRHGHNAVVIIAYEEYQQITEPATDIVTFFRSSPLMVTDIDLSRNRDSPRSIEL